MRQVRDNVGRGSGRDSAKDSGRVSDYDCGAATPAATLTATATCVDCEREIENGNRFSNYVSFFKIIRQTDGTDRQTDDGRNKANIVRPFSECVCVCVRIK